MADTTIIHGGATFIAIEEEFEDESKAEFVCEYLQSGGNVFWIYECTGSHEGNPIKIAVKNIRQEPDGDDQSVWYCLAHDGLFWADNLDDLDDAVCDWYSDAVMDAAKADYDEMD